MGAIWDTIFLLATGCYLLLNSWALWKWRGIWRRLALILLLIMAGVAGLTGFLFYQGSNIWPLLLIFAMPSALFALVVLYLTKIAAKT